MPGVDWIPGVSQLKAGLQLITGDVEGAARTTKNFFRECPVVSQATSVVQFVAGDEEGALETQRRCLGTINNVANGIPVVGHVKGVIHHAVGDYEGGNQALNAATRTSVVLASGAAAGIATGGIGAIPAGIAAGGAYDITDSLINDKPKGFVAAVENVVQNPSAGSFFDATAVVVGDGLAGYSGGKIGNKVASQVKLGKLEATRMAKTDQLNAAMFDEAGGSMTSGQMLSLGEQINALTSEINTIRQGTPQFWFDPKSKQVVVKSSPNGMAVPVVGYVEEGKEAEVFKQVWKDQENGLLADLYATEVASGPTEKNKDALRKYKSQSQGDKTLAQAYPNVQVSSREKLTQQKGDDKQDPKRNLKKKLEILNRNSWLAVRMPSQFNYTGAIMVNNLFQGLLHSFVRHGNQWENFISNFDTMTADVLRAIGEHLNRIKMAKNSEQSRAALIALLEYLKTLDNETFVAVESAFIDIQVALHRFLQDNVTNSNYLGEGVNVNGQQQVFFKVKDRHGNVQVMVVCVSSQLYRPDSGCFGDSRPVRSITTVFFISWSDYLKRHVGKNF